MIEVEVDDEAWQDAVADVAGVVERAASVALGDTEGDAPGDRVGEGEGVAVGVPVGDGAGAYVHRVAPDASVALIAYTRALPAAYTAEPSLDTVGLRCELLYTTVLMAHARVPFANTLCSQLLFSD